MHHNRLKWHNHTIDKGRTRIRWLKSQAGDDGATPSSKDTANAVLGTAASESSDEMEVDETTVVIL